MQVRKLLGDINYLAGKDEVVDTLSGEGADENGLSVLRRTRTGSTRPNAGSHEISQAQ